MSAMTYNEYQVYMDHRFQSLEIILFNIDSGRYFHTSKNEDSWSLSSLKTVNEINNNWPKELLLMKVYE
jgi:hypothetical protein